MIEISERDAKFDAAKVTGKFLVMTLPLGEFKSVYPGAVVFVEKADTAKGKMEVRPTRSSMNDLGDFTRLDIVGGVDNVHTLRLEPMTVFLCDTVDDAMLVLGCRRIVDDMIARDAGFIDAAVIGRQIEAVYQDCMDEARRNAVSKEPQSLFMRYG